MNREIKFRAWDKIHKAWETGRRKTVLWEEIGELANKLKDNEIILTQYIGLKDRNGKEIYEKDIVKIYLRDGTVIEDGIINFGLMRSFYVKYFGESGEHCFINDENAGSFSDSLADLEEYAEIDCNDLEIIGNIFENKKFKKYV